MSLSRIVQVAFCLSIWGNCCYSAAASELRISRPLPAAPSSCCQNDQLAEQGEGLSEKPQIVWPGSALAHFNHWRKRYIDPVMCPILLCHGSCGDFDDACILERGIVLKTSKGCAGSCN